MHKYILFVGLLFYPLGLFSQVTISGKILDAETNESIIAVSISIPNSQIGTTSDRDGYFRLVIPDFHYGKSVVFSCIGYKNLSIPIKEYTVSRTILLEPDIYQLESITVYSEDKLRTLLRTAYEKINENYPQAPTRYEGFLRESLQDAESGQYLYFIESAIDVFKDSYSKSNDLGQVKLTQSRSYKAPSSMADTINNVYFYGSGYRPITSDVVLQHIDLIKPTKYKSYKFALNGFVKSNSKTVYDISFESSKAKGKIYIDSTSFAYVGFDFVNKGKYNSSLSISLEDRVRKIRYIQDGELWYLLSVGYFSETKNNKTGKKMYYGSEYITTKVDFKTAQPIPYSERISYNQPLFLIATPYDSLAWGSYDAIIRDSSKVQLRHSIYESQSILNKKSTNTVVEQNNKKFIETLLPILLKFDFAIGFSYNSPINISGIHSVVYTPISGSNPVKLSEDISDQPGIVALDLAMGYQMNPRWRLFLNSNLGSLLQKSIKSGSNQLGMEYSINLNKKGRRLSLHPALSFSWDEAWLNMGTAANSWGEFKTGGKTFDADKLSYAYGLKRISIDPGISLRKQLTRRVSIDLFLQYNIILDSKYNMRLKEETGFFMFRKKLSAPDIKGMEFFKNDIPYQDPELFKLGTWQSGIRFLFN